MAITHGHAGRRKNGKWVQFPSPTYVSWEGMRRRVTPVHSNHKYYTHVKICERWLRFENFLADMGERPKGMTLDRIDTDGGYCPENCRWATWSEQNKNRRPFTKRTSKIITFNGITMTSPEWAKHLGIPTKLLYSRLYRGMSIERAFSTCTLSRVTLRQAPAD